METPSIRTNFPYSLATHSVMKTFAIDLDGWGQLCESK